MPPLPSGFSSRDQLEFINHCINGETEQVRCYLESDRVYPHYYHPANGWTALHFAARCGVVDVVKVLLDSGFEAAAIGYCEETAYDVAHAEGIEDLHTLLDLLHCEGRRRRKMPQDGRETPTSLSPPRRGSISSEGYTPPFVSMSSSMYTPSVTSPRKPLPLSASRSTSFDFTSGPGSPGIPPSTPSYSYGRRDSLYRTRFLLVRTSHGNGKEAYTRVTLPGGSGVEQLKKTIEKAMKGKKVEAVFSLPDRSLIEHDDQICLFGNSQKIDVMFGDEEASPEPVGDSPPSPLPSRKISCPERASTSYSAHPCFSQRQVSMDIPTTIREGSPVREVEKISEDTLKDTSLVEMPTMDEVKEISYSPDPSIEILKRDEEVAKEEIVVVKREEERDEHPVEPTPTPVTPSSPTLLTIPVQKSVDEEEEEEGEQVVERARQVVIRKASDNKAEPEQEVEKEKEEEPVEETPQKVDSVRSDSVGGFEEVSREDLVEATKEETVEVREVEVKREEEKKEGNGVVPVVKVTKADSSSSPLADFINEHPELIKQLAVVGAIGAACGVAYMVMRKPR